MKKNEEREKKEFNNESVYDLKRERVHKVKIAIIFWQ